MSLANNQRDAECLAQDESVNECFELSRAGYDMREADRASRWRWKDRHLLEGAILLGWKETETRIFREFILGTSGAVFFLFWKE